MTLDRFGRDTTGARGIEPKQPGGAAVAIDVSIPTDPTDVDSAEDALERALGAWRTARERLQRIDPNTLEPELRERYVQTLIYIGLWADARVCTTRGDDDEEDTGDEDGETDEPADAAVGQERRPHPGAGAPPLSLAATESDSSCED
jgi:hypothetical protein